VERYFPKLGMLPTSAIRLSEQAMAAQIECLEQLINDKSNALMPNVKDFLEKTAFFVKENVLAVQGNVVSEQQRAGVNLLVAMQGFVKRFKELSHQQITLALNKIRGFLYVIYSGSADHSKNFSNQDKRAYLNFLQNNKGLLKKLDVTLNTFSFAKINLDQLSFMVFELVPPINNTVVEELKLCRERMQPH
jgi:hypothetical protein